MHSVDLVAAIHRDPDGVIPRDYQGGIDVYGEGNPQIFVIGHAGYVCGPGSGPTGVPLTVSEAVAPSGGRVTTLVL